MRNVASHLVVLVLGLSAGIGGIAVASSDGTPQARTSAADSRIISRLDTLNQNVRGIQKQLGGNPDTDIVPYKTIPKLLSAICVNTQPERSHTSC